MNREAWLTSLAEKIENEVFYDYSLPAYRVSCGWPSRRGTGKRRRVGECHSPLHSAAGVHELFVSPILDDPMRIAGVLCHELAHVVAGVAQKHGAHFREVCRGVGLTRGRWAGIKPGEILEGRLRGIVENLPEYPHKKLLVYA